MTEYEIRQYKPVDRDGFLSLYSTVMGGNKSDDWFDWKYGSNPYVDHVPMVVSLCGDQLVGARPLFALPIVINGEQSVALEPGDAMVHPDHRRQGLFTRMMEQIIETYSGRYPFYFSFPNDLAKPAHIKHGSRVVSQRPSYYRIEDPSSIAETYDQPAIRFLGRVGTTVARGYYLLRDLTTPENPGVAIRMESESPAEELAALYRLSVPEKIHVRRDERFYRWQFKNPDWDYKTYIADGSGGPEAALITKTSVESDLKTTEIVDVVPLQVAPEPALVSLIGQVISDHPETDLFIAPSQGIPGSVLRTSGFHADTIPPLSFVSTQQTHVVRTLTDEWTQNGMDITNPDNWFLTSIERDTS